MREISTKKKTSTITFRFDQDLIERLQKEAKNHCNSGVKEISRVGYLST